MRGLYFITLLIASFCLVSYYAVTINPRELGIFSLFHLVFPFLFFTNIFCIFFWLILDWKRMIIPIIILAIGYSHLMNFFSFGQNEKKICNETCVQVITYNLYGLKNLKDTFENKYIDNIRRFTAFIQSKNPDVFCVQEDNPYSHREILKLGLFPNYHFLTSHGAAIYSKHPIIDKGIVDIGKGVNTCLWADILIEGRSLRVYSAHLLSNVVSQDAESLVNNPPQKNAEAYNKLKRIFSKYYHKSFNRIRQAELIKKHANAARNHVIICGDFNDTPFSYTYKTLSEGMKDSFKEASFGLGTTYSGLLPGLRIDYILSDPKSFEVCSHKVYQAPFSDHLPVSVKLQFLR